MENQSTASETPSMQNHVIRHGTIMGIICVAITAVAYLTSLAFMGSFKFIGLVLVVCIGYVIYAGIDYRKEIGGYITYGKAFVLIILIFAISGLINTLFGMVLYHVVDTELAQKMTDVIVANTEEMMTSMGAPQATIDKQLADMRTEMPDQFTIVGNIMNYFKGLGMYLFLTLICAIFVRRNVPVEM